MSVTLIQSAQLPAFNVAVHRARVLLILPDGTAADLAPLVLGLNRECLDGQLPFRVSVDVANGEIGTLGEAFALCALGGSLLYQTSEDAGITWRDDPHNPYTIWTNTPDASRETFSLTCYDVLAYLDYDYQLVLAEGPSGGDDLRHIFATVGIPYDRIDGPTCAMPRISHDGKLTDVVLAILDHAVYVGDKSYRLDVNQGVVSVLAPGADFPIYCYGGPKSPNTVLALDSSYALSDTTNQVIVIGNSNGAADSARPRLQSVASTDSTDQALSGTKQKIVKGARFDSQEAADKAAAATLNQKQEIRRDRKVTVALSNPVDKGYLVEIHKRELDGYFVVLGFSQDEDALTQELTIGDEGTPIWQAKKLDDALAPLVEKSTDTSTKTTSTPSDKVQQLLQWCRDHLGTPYVWAGGHPNLISGGWDCSGYVDNAFAAVGIGNFGWGGTGSMRSARYMTQISGPKPGAIVFFGSVDGTEHVGIVAEDTTKHYNASAPGVGTVVSSIAGSAAYKNRGIIGYYWANGL